MNENIKIFSDKKYQCHIHIGHKMKLSSFTQYYVTLSLKDTICNCLSSIKNKLIGR